MPQKIYTRKDILANNLFPFKSKDLFIANAKAGVIPQGRLVNGTTIYT